MLWFYITLPDPLFDTPYATVVEDRRGELLGARIADDGQWRFPAPEAVPLHFEQSLLLFEDRHFYRHPGVNPFSILRAARQNREAGRTVSGGSTLSMQVIRLSRGNPPRTVTEKIREIFTAMALELRYSKEEILTLYATHAPFGGNVVGLEAASWRYFGRSPDMLTLAESATLAVLPNAPALIFPGRNQQALLEKRNRLLHRLHTQGIIDELDLELALTEPLPGPPQPLPGQSPHLLDRFISDGGKGKRLESTLNAGLQQRTRTVLDEHRERLSANQIHNMAALVADTRSGEILAYVGNSSDPNRRGAQVDVITAPRSPGSALKPLLYFLQLNEGWLLPDMLVADIPSRFGGYAPRNFSQTYDGAVPAGTALARSLNVPAVRNLQQYGVPRFHHFLQSMGMTTLNRPPEHYGLSLILGGAEVTMWDLANMYFGMAQTLSKYDPADPSTRFWLNSSLRYNKLQKPETGYNTDFPVHPSAIWSTFSAMEDLTRPPDEVNWREFASARNMSWKTGTSFGYRDGWAVGITAEYLVVVWAGNADGEGRPGLTGIDAAAPALFGIMNLLGGTSRFPEPMFDMSYVEICSRSGHRAGPDCDHTQIRAIPRSGLETDVCPYHRRVHLDKTLAYRVNSNCYSISEMQPVSWFVLPPVMEWFYRSGNTYRSLPPLHPECDPSGTENAMALIYPDDVPSIYVPVEIDGSPGRTVFEAAHRNPSTRIWWHLGDEFLGETRGVHQVSLNPEPGTYLLSLVDENGESIRKHIRILGRK